MSALRVGGLFMWQELEADLIPATIWLLILGYSAIECDQASLNLNTCPCIYSAEGGIYMPPVRVCV